MHFQKRLHVHILLCGIELKNMNCERVFNTMYNHEFTIISGENKTTICKKLQNAQPNPLEVLEVWWHSPNFLQREVGFCAKWCLDNLCK